MQVVLQFEADAPKDWSLVAWGEDGDVFVYNLDGSESSHWAMGGSMMKKYGPKKDRPNFGIEGLKHIKIPNMPPPQKETVWPPERTPDPPKYSPGRRFREWV